MMAVFCFLYLWVALQSALAQVDFDAFDYQVYLDEAETFLLAWTVDATKTNVTIAVSAPTTGWAAFALSPTGSMPLSDVAFFWVDDQGAVFLQDRHTTDTRSDGPVLDSTQNLILLQGEEVNGKTNVVFQRSVTPCDTADDYAIVQGTSRVLFAYSGDDSDPTMTAYNAANPEESEVDIAYHQTNRGSRSVNLFDGTQLQVELEAGYQTFDVVVDNYNMPAAKTTYYETYHQLPVSGSETFHIIKFEPVVTAGNELNVHHLVLYYCPTAAVNSGCITAAYAWAIGAEAMTFPADVGLEMSTSYLNYVKLQIHYDNPDELSTVIDSSGVRIYYTSTLRTYDAGLVEFGLPLGAWQFIPPGIPDALNTAYCMSECTGAANAIPDTGIYAFSAFLHEHTLGTAIQLRHIRAGAELAPIATNWAYDFDYQQGQPLSEHALILPGDEFILDCYYDSTEQTSIVYGGESTEEEMCQAYVYVYPRPTLGTCISAFTEGQLSAWVQLALAAGYLTGSSEANYAYNLGGNPYTYSGITWQNGSDFYRFLWEETELSVLATRQQRCSDIAGAPLANGTEFAIPSGFTPYETTSTCSSIDTPVGQIGDYSTSAPTAPTTPAPTTPAPTAAGTGNTLCGEATSDGTSTDVSVSVCVDLDDDTVSITLSGPSDVWFGVGFGATGMTDAYAMCVYGDGLSEHGEFILAGSPYGAGAAAPFDGGDGIVFVDQTEENGQVSVTVQRDRESSESGVYSFPSSAGTINVIFGKGASTQYLDATYMGGHSSGAVELVLSSVLTETSTPIASPTVAPTTGTDGNSATAVSFKLVWSAFVFVFFGFM